MIAALLIVATAGCGAVYQASTRIRGYRMLNSLEVGQTASELRSRWGQPDIISETGPDAQVWSYAKRPNSDDVTASVFYTSAKEGDEGTFVDLHLVNGKLQSWTEAKHRMPRKQGTAFGYSIGAGPGAAHF